MPELPEMETYKELLRPLIINKPISNVEITRDKSINLPASNFISSLVHNRIVRIERRAKMLLFYCQNGEVLLLHLMLGGWMFYGIEEQKPKRSIQILISFENQDQSLYFIGLRLGYLHLFRPNELHTRLDSIGPEPLSDEFDLSYFQSIVEKRKVRIKTALLDQSWIAGIGNGYSDEICYHAGLLPMRELQQLNNQEIRQLYYSMQSTLQSAIEHGGYMDHPLFVEDQLTGGYNTMFRVHSRHQETCYRCGEEIKMQTINSRKTYFCVNCQN